MSTKKQDTKAKAEPEAPVIGKVQLVGYLIYAEYHGMTPDQMQAADTLASPEDVLIPYKEWRAPYHAEYEKIMSSCPDSWVDWFRARLGLPPAPEKTPKKAS